MLSMREYLEVKNFPVELDHLPVPPTFTRGRGLVSTLGYLPRSGSWVI